MIPISRPTIGSPEIEAAVSVLQSGLLASGERVRTFEQKFSAYCGVPHGVAVNSGTAALHAALLAGGIGPGDEVIVPTFSFFATASCVNMAGARPVFVDVDPLTFNLDPSLVEGSITPRTKAIIGVHLFGHPFDLKVLRELCAAHQLLLIEDAAQAHGATYQNKRVGSWGEMACFSFYATKNMTTGEGGMVTTNSFSYAEALRMIINHGQQEKYCHTRLGYNYRMTDLAAALGLAQLKNLDRWNAIRRANAAYFCKHLSCPGIVLPTERPAVTHVYHQYILRVTEECALSRAALIEHLTKRGIGTAIHYPLPIHRQPYYRDTGYLAPYPVADRLTEEVVSIPVHPQVSEGDREYICAAINEVR
jgi:perosamine synthetase